MARLAVASSSKDATSVTLPEVSFFLRVVSSRSSTPVAPRSKRSLETRSASSGETWTWRNGNRGSWLMEGSIANAAFTRGW
jgi:hypothetical protein